MVENNQYRIDFPSQVAAATKGQQGVAVRPFDDRWRNCVADAVAAGGDDAGRLVNKAVAAVQRLPKS
jgi:hypothetical protein